MDLLKSLKNALTEEVDDNKSPTLQPPKAFPPPPINPTYNSQQATSFVTPDEINTLDKSSKDKLDQAILAKSPQFYVKLNDLLSTLAEDIPSESARYKTAIKLLTKDGATIPALISDLNLCVSAVESANNDFSIKVSKKIEDQVNSHKSTIATIDSQVQAKTQQIQALQQELITLAQNKEQETSLINTESQKLNLRKDRFTIVYNQLHDQLINQKQKLAEYTK